REGVDGGGADVGEDEDGSLPPSVPGDGGEVLLEHGDALLDEHAARPLALDLELEDRAGRLLGGSRVIGELHAARLHASAGEDLRLQHDGTADLGSGRAGLGGGLRHAAFQQRDAVSREERFGLVLVESHRRARGRWRATTRPQARSRRRIAGAGWDVGGASLAGGTAATAPSTAFSAWAVTLARSSIGAFPSSDAAAASLAASAAISRRR